ncbi:hypothetical protein AB1Y20_021545 [Prymnesium parvum]|uniref:Uncharacterized protein n=1 Tax=Prymnesium parvum TaxID=97485 RepID=A0AB34JJ05_PRYPA
MHSRSGSIEQKAYRTVEEYLAELEKRQGLEEAPPAAVFLLGSEQMLHVAHGSFPWLTRVRCELPLRPLGAGGVEPPIRAVYVSANDAHAPREEQEAGYASFVRAMAAIDVRSCVWLEAARPGRKALALLEQADIVVLADGSDHAGGFALLEDERYAIGERIKWRYYCGAVLIGIGSGAMQIGKRGWTGDPMAEVRANAEHRHDQQAALKAYQASDFRSYKAFDIVPLLICQGETEAEAIVQHEGGGAIAFSIPPRGAVIFNTDGTYEPANSFIVEVSYDWRSKETKTALLGPPDTAEGIMLSVNVLQRLKKKRKEQAAALGYEPSGIPKEEEETEEEDEEEEEEGEEEAAEELFKSRTSTLDRTLADKYRAEGAEFVKMGKWEEALLRFTRAIERDPTDFRNHLNRSLCYLKLGKSKGAALAADRALHLSRGKSAKAWFRRASAFLAAGEFNECLYDLSIAQRLEPGDKAIAELRKKAEEERETQTFTFASDCRKLRDREQSVTREEAGTKAAMPYGDLDAVKTMVSIEEFEGSIIELIGTHRLTLAWDDGREKSVSPSPLDRRSLFCFEDATKRTGLRVLKLKDCCLGPWGAQFISRGARVHDRGRLECVAAINCRLRAEGVAPMASLMRASKTLTELDLSANAVGDEGLHTLSEALCVNETLESLSLRSNRIGNARIGHLSRSVARHPVLRSLDLSDNYIGFPGACHLTEALRKNKVIEKLFLAWNKLRSDSLWRLASVCIGHDTLLLLDLRGIKLRASDRLQIDEQTKYKRVQIKLSAAACDLEPSQNAPSSSEKNESCQSSITSGMLQSGPPAHIEHNLTSSPSVRATVFSPSRTQYGEEEEIDDPCWPMNLTSIGFY